jgi:hypothetical protein
MKKLMLLSASALLFVACQNPSPSAQAEYSPISFEVSGSQLPATDLECRIGDCRR